MTAEELRELLRAAAAVSAGPRRPLKAQRCACIGGPLVDHQDIKHGIVTCFRCGKRPADRVLARQGKKR
jgi:hypothetical protein